MVLNGSLIFAFFDMLYFWKYHFIFFNCLPSKKKGKAVMTQKTTDEIRALLSNAKLDFDSVENKALNYYLPKIFHSCPFTEDLCTAEQCLDCAVFNKLHSEK